MTEGMTAEKKRIVVLGSTGSVGTNVLDVVSKHREYFEVVGVAAGRNVDRLLEQCRDCPDAHVAVSDQQSYRKIVGILPDAKRRTVGPGSEALLDLIERTQPDLVVNCLVGFVGLRPTLFALAAGISIALANKEAVVAGGELLRREANATGAAIVPIDSEHVAITQCIAGSPISDVRKVYLTASGGALREYPLDRMDTVGREDVLAHPTWNMGDKITVDSATMLNKGLEVIEAHWLFDLPYEKIGVVIHPQSIVHSLVEFRDNSIIAQMGVPDMRLPILYALSYPKRIDATLVRSLPSEFPPLSFAQVEEERYPCFGLAVRAAKAGGNAPTILNSANEIAVGAFLADKIRYVDIYKVIETALDSIPEGDVDSFEDVLETDRRTRSCLHEKFGI